jgi:hypothetical protein
VAFKIIYGLLSGNAREIVLAEKRRGPPGYISKNYNLPPELVAAVGAFRYRREIRSETEAVIRLLERGLRAEGEPGLGQTAKRRATA